MMRSFEFGIVTDELSRDLGEALEIAGAWGLSRFELREGSQQRFPFWTRDEIHGIEMAVRQGAQVTAVSPGLFKGSVAQEKQLKHELEKKLPESIDLAVRLDCPLLILFGFEMDENEPVEHRVRVLRAFERAAEAASEAGLHVAFENEPRFWIDTPEESIGLLNEIGHPALGINWDPANQHWGGREPTYDDFNLLKPWIANVHLKDYTPDDTRVPWRAIGEGITPWSTILPWIIHETSLPHATLETHVDPLIENARKSLDAVQKIKHES